MENKDNLKHYGCRYSVSANKALDVVEVQAIIPGGEVIARLTVRPEEVGWFVSALLNAAEMLMQIAEEEQK